MNRVICVLAFYATLCHSLTLPITEAPSSAISVYTTLTPETAPPNVYQQIATNLAGKITSPILTFLGFGKQNTTQPPLTPPSKPLNLETFDEPALKPIDNELRPIDRDVEQVTPERKRQDAKPEKITLYSSYQQQNGTRRKYAQDLNSQTEATGRQGGFVYFLEMLGSIAQLALGAIMALFKPATSSSTGTS